MVLFSFIATELLNTVLSLRRLQIWRKGSSPVTGLGRALSTRPEEAFPRKSQGSLQLQLCDPIDEGAATQLYSLSQLTTRLSRAALEFVKTTCNLLGLDSEALRGALLLCEVHCHLAECILPFTHGFGDSLFTMPLAFIFRAYYCLCVFVRDGIPLAMLGAQRLHLIATLASCACLCWQCFGSCNDGFWVRKQKSGAWCVTSAERVVLWHGIAYLFLVHKCRWLVLLQCLALCVACCWMCASLRHCSFVICTEKMWNLQVLRCVLTFSSICCCVMSSEKN